jgi:hypothetical protein
MCAVSAFENVLLSVSRFISLCDIYWETNEHDVAVEVDLFPTLVPSQHAEPCNHGYEIFESEVKCITP